MIHAKNRRMPAVFTALALIFGLLIGQVGAASSASAVEENGYVFNNAWTLTGDSVSGPNTNPTFEAHNTAASSLPTGGGSIGLEAEFEPNSARPPGTTYLTAGTDQGNYGGTAPMFVGSPTPGALPALGLVANAAPECGGAMGSAAYHNFDGVCDVGQLTLTFDKPVTDAVLDITGLGGNASFTATHTQTDEQWSRGSFNTTQWTVSTPGVSFEAPAGTSPTNLQINGSSMRVSELNTGPRCDSAGTSGGSANGRSPEFRNAGCGSVVLKGTYDTVTLDLASISTPYTNFPTAQFGTGSNFFNTAGQYRDSVNGLNRVIGEAHMFPPDVIDALPVLERVGFNRLENSDLQRISVRLAAPGSLGDRVWFDADRNGLQDEGENGVAGVTVNLLDAEGEPVLDENGTPITTTTADDGSYLFDNLPLGEYSVEFVAPDGRDFTQANVGDDDAADSDADVLTGKTEPVTLTAENPDVLTVDAGLVEPIRGSIGDFVWRDNNGDGVQDDDEPGVEGVTVNLLDGDGNPVEGPDGNPITTTTDSEGAYLFPNLPLGDYIVEFIAPDGTTLSPPNAGDDDSEDSDAGEGGRTHVITLTEDQRDDLTVDAGLVPLGSLGDRVWMDTNRDGIQDDGEEGVADVEVALLDGDGNPVNDDDGNPITTTTNADGEYLFENLPLGEYQVQFTAPDGLNFTLIEQGGDVETDSNAGPTGRTGTVELTADTPDRRDVDAGLIVPVGSIGDYVWRDDNGDGIQDADEPGVPDVTVNLLDGDGNPVNDEDGNPITTTTDADGRYLFDELRYGDYIVEFVAPDGTKLSPPGQPRW